MTVAELLARNAGAESEAAPPVEDSKFDGLVKTLRRLEGTQHQLASAQHRIELAQARLARDVGSMEHRESMRRARPPEPSVHEVLRDQFTGRDAMLLSLQKQVNDLTVLMKKEGYRLDKLERRLDLEEPVQDEEAEDEEETFSDRLRRRLPVSIERDEEQT